jgi:uncharacterized protein (TIGR03083 family)
MTAPDPADLLAALDALADGEAEPAPRALLDRIRRAATDERGVGVPSVPVAEADPLDAVRSQIEAVRSVLRSLEPADWERHVQFYDWEIQTLVGHLVGVEAYVGSLLGLWSFEITGAEDDHVAVTLAQIEHERTRSPLETLATWEEQVDAILAHVAAGGPELLAQDVAFHTYPFSVGSMLVAHTFELWTHADDVRGALGRPLEPPTPGVLRAMSDLSVRNLFSATLVTAPHQFERSAKVVLTGPGGGYWLLGDPPGEPDVTIVADVVEYCRMVSRRLDAAELDADIRGDRQLALDLFEASQLLAA